MIQANYLKTIYVRTAPCVTPSMLSADYWIAKCEKPDTVILSPEEISEQNRHISEQLSSGETATEIQYGICCTESAVRCLPTTEIRTESGDPYSDENRFSGILVNEPVQILGSAENGRWYHIRTYYGSGWILSDHIARCRNLQEWLDAQSQPEVPLVVTAGWLTLQTERTAPQKEPASYSMGTCLRLIPAVQAPKTVDDRFYFDNYVVQVPSRNPEGYLTWEYKLIPVSEDVHPGWLPYTSRNVLRQIFKLQGTVYGWGDTYRSHDCSSYAMAVYRCFGFRLARNSSDQIKMPFPSANLQQMSSREKTAALSHALPGSILGFRGHIVLYLGHEKDRYYGISATGRCIPRKGEQPVSAGTAFLCELETTCRRNGCSWLSEFQTLLELK